MDMDEAVNADNKEQLQVEETDDSCILDYIEIVPVDRNTDGSFTTECVSGDWSAEVSQENLAVVKQEPDDVCCVILVYLFYIQFITAERSYADTWYKSHFSVSVQLCYNCNCYTTTTTTTC